MQKSRTREISFSIPAKYYALLTRLVEAGVEEVELCRAPEWYVLYPQVNDAYPATLHRQIQQLGAELLQTAQALGLNAQGVCIQATHKLAFCYH